MKAFRYIDVHALNYDQAAVTMYELGITRVACNLDDFISRGYKGRKVSFPMMGMRGLDKVDFYPIPECPRGYVFAMGDEEDRELDKSKERIAYLETELTKAISERNAAQMSQTDLQDQVAAGVACFQLQETAIKALRERNNALERSLQSIKDLSIRGLS